MGRKHQIKISETIVTNGNIVANDIVINLTNENIVRYFTNEKCC